MPLDTHVGSFAYSQEKTYLDSNDRRRVNKVVNWGLWSIIVTTMLLLATTLAGLSTSANAAVSLGSQKQIHFEPFATSVVTQIAASDDVSCALLGSGAVDCWGSDLYRVLGLTKQSNASLPQAVTGLGGVTQVSLNTDSSSYCAVLSSGAVDCWGYNQYGQLGGGTATNTDSGEAPAPVAGISGATQVSVGGEVDCAVLSGGTVDCWGENGLGEFGDGTVAGFEAAPSTPTPSFTGVGAVAQVATGTQFTCVLLSAGTVDCAGLNSGGQLGDGSTAFSSYSPVAVSGLSGVTQIATSSDFACALLSGGTVECWGGDLLGDIDSSTPVTVEGLTGVKQISTGANGVCALLASGTVDCWGYGPLGNGTSSNSPTPVSVSNLSGVTQIASGDEDSCAVTHSGTVYCWGVNSFGEVGNGTSDAPALVPAEVKFAASVSFRPASTTVTFSSKSSGLSARAKSVLTAFVKKLGAGETVTITGYARGSTALARKRATGVADYLKSRVELHVVVKVVSKTTASEVTVKSA
jgi:alpha-tubulin suppressor-like RCC1 family protein